MYDFNDSTDTLKFWTEKWAINKTFLFFIHHNYTKFHQNQMKNKKSFINSPFFCSEFQSVSRIVKIVHSAWCALLYYVMLIDCPLKILQFENVCWWMQAGQVEKKKSLFALLATLSKKIQCTNIMRSISSHFFSFNKLIDVVGGKHMHYAQECTSIVPSNAPHTNLLPHTEKTLKDDGQSLKP